ncbi:MAG TPA: Spx/MgsR family RNA polymerase-binding regulatory protein [Epsilonproteobacteria bacterium]|nr:Spx/MgsR family RNA polymerase-binding regulatory protein [Campylobacterota bacterium]HHH37297.1 Spx/MgsR family RNA polymerase-binding regulatory protein [Campylobacterota bacterium]
MIKMYGIKNCDSVRKAVKFLKTHEIDFTFHDTRESPVDAAEIQKWIERGASIKQLFNTRGTTYRTLKLKEKNLDDSGKLAYMAKENMLIKRPVILSGDKILLGYNESLFQEYLA